MNYFTTENTDGYTTAHIEKLNNRLKKETDDTMDENTIKSIAERIITDFDTEIAQEKNEQS